MCLVYRTLVCVNSETVSSPTKPPAAKSVPWWERLAPYVEWRPTKLLWCVAVSIVGQVCVGLLPWIQKVIVDDVILSKGEPLWPWLAGMIGMGVLGFGLHYIRRYLAASISLELQHDLRVAIYRHVHQLDQARLNEMSPGEIMSRAAGDVTLIQMFVNQIPLFTANVTLLCVAVAVMLSLSPLLSLVILALVPAFAILSVRFRDTVFASTFSDQRAAAAVAGVVEEAVSGIRIVKAFAQEERETSLFVERARHLFQSRLRTSRLTASYSATIQALPTLGQLGVFAWGGWLVLSGNSSLGVVLAFFSYLVQLLAPIRLLSNILSGSQQARVGAERLLGLLQLRPRIAEAPNGRRSLEPCRGSLTLSGVHFAYPGEAAPVIRGVSFEVASGERLGIVGASGSGKTTLVQLLARFYDPQSGAIRLDGVDLRELSLAFLRKHVAIVSEETFLFATSIRENIAFGRPDATMEEVERAARAACAHDFIMQLPGGYESRVGEAGSTLSGGQRQRIGLARMFLHDPKVLILDDATSAIDASTEEAIFESLQAMMTERTVIVIAHRPSTLRLVSRCLVLGDGRIVADGSPAELARTSVHYQRLLLGPDLQNDLPKEVQKDVLEVAVSERCDPLAWPEDGIDEENRAPSLRTEVDLLASRGMHGGGGGARDFGAHRAAFFQETPELLARIEALPPLQGEPPSDIGELRPSPSGFRLRDLLRPFTWSLFGCLGLVLVDSCTTLLAPYVIGRGMDQAIPSRDGRALAIAVGILALIHGTSWLNSRYLQFWTAKTTERLLFTLRVRTFSHLQRLSLDYFDRELGGRIMARMTTDVEAFAQLFQQGMLTAVVSLFTCGGVLALMLSLDWSLSACAFAVLLPLFVGTWLFRRSSQQAYLDARERIGRLYGNLQESIAGIQVTQTFAREAESLDHFRKLSDAYRLARQRSMHVMSIYFPYLQLLAVTGKVITLAVGARYVTEGRVSAGILLAFLLYMDQFFAPLQQLSGVFDQWIQARVSFRRLQELLQTHSSTPEPEAPIEPGVLEGKVRFEAVRFSYGPQNPEALRGVDLEIQPGEQVSLVGTTGAGKSTFVKLAARFYDPSAGSVSVDGIPLPQLALQGFRRQIGYVPQEAFLFSGTVRSNIAYGKPDATDLEVERAARAAGAHEFICRLSRGYLTPVSARGRTLSAGQRQLICLARVALIDPRILILDEATAKLDLETEAHVKQAVKRVAHGRTTLIIAHRLQTARHADRILVLDDGRIVESGSHERLLAVPGRYQRLWQDFTDAQGRPS